MERARFYRYTRSPFFFKMMLLRRLPSAMFMGLSVAEIDERRCSIRLPYGWRSQNPFHSTYFAAQCAAGEMSTGLLLMAALQDRPPASMLITRIEADFLKKATDTLLFTCENGPEVDQIVRQAIETGEGQTLTCTSASRLPDGTEASRVVVTWRIKVRKGEREKGREGDGSSEFSHNAAIGNLI